MKKIKSFTLMCIISVLCITQVKAKPSELGFENPNQLDSLIKESIIMSYDFFFKQDDKKYYFIVKDHMSRSFNIDILAKELGVQVVSFSQLYKHRVLGRYTKPNGKVVAKNFAKYFRGDLKEERGRGCIIKLENIIVDNIYIYIYISTPVFYKTSKGWHDAISVSSMNRYCYEYSPKEKKWNLVDIVNSSDRRVPLPNKEMQQ